MVTFATCGFTLNACDVTNDILLRFLPDAVPIELHKVQFAAFIDALFVVDDVNLEACAVIIDVLDVAIGTCDDASVTNSDFMLFDDSTLDLFSLISDNLASLPNTKCAVAGGVCLPNLGPGDDSTD